MKQLFCALLLVAFQSCGTQHQPGNPQNKAEKLWDDYERYREPSITNRFFKHADIVALIDKHEKNTVFQNEVAGRSVEGRSIHHLTLGEGNTRVLLWSQMHGNESTATMALFDLFNFFSAKDEYDSLRYLLRSKLELHFVPMLNPDGAEVWQRRNALDIDLNRDARQQATPEAKILAKLQRDLKPSFGFNLHDQSVYYTAGATRNPATISFLAPAYNDAKDMNDVRATATRLIVGMNRALQSKIPGKVAKYDDTHDPRCFGDSFQGWGTSTVLIESGGYPDDIEKQHIRKLNFYALVTALTSIAEGSYERESLSAYDTIPENSRLLYDLVIRNVEVQTDSTAFTTHVAINRAQVPDARYRSVDFRGVITDVGDLHRHFGYEDVDATGLKYSPGSVKTMRKHEWQRLTREDELRLIRDGFLFVKWSDAASRGGSVRDRLLNVINLIPRVRNAPATDQSANFLLTKDGIARYAVVNGFILDLKQENPRVINTIAY